jgi:hypothetical protein
MNRKTDFGPASAAPSSLASTANRLTATESAFPETINDFVRDMTSLLDEVGLNRVETGAVGIGKLHFVLATASRDA